MIFYDNGDFAAWALLKWRGSVVPWACVWALGATIFEATLRHSTSLHHIVVNVIDTSRDATSLAFLWGGFTAALGVLLSIRTNASYQRFWEGARLVYLVRGEWFNCVSSLLSFVSEDAAVVEEAVQFQNVLVRLASLLHCVALQHVCEVAEDSLEVLDTDGLSEESLVYLETVHDRCDVLVQWMQRLIVTAHRTNVVDVAPPILTRSFQELSRGVVNLNNVRRIKDIPFPYPYHQAIILLLFVHWFTTPFLACLYINSAVLSSLFVFVGQAGMWTLIYIANQLDQPFGEDSNDLPMADLQQDFNRSLISLLHPLSKQVPTYTQPSEDSPVRVQSHGNHKTLKMDFTTLAGEHGETPSPTQASDITPSGDGIQYEKDLEKGGSNLNIQDKEVLHADLGS